MNFIGKRNEGPVVLDHFVTALNEPTQYPLSSPLTPLFIFYMYGQNKCDAVAYNEQLLRPLSESAAYQSMKYSYQNMSGVAFAVLSALLFTFVDLTVRFSSSYFSVWHMLFGRTVIGLVLMIVLAKFLRINLWGYNRRAMWITGLINVSSVICFMIALIALPLFEALVLLYLYPVFAGLISPFITHEKTNLATWLLIVIAFFGTIMILWPEGAGAFWRWGHLTGITAAFGQGLTLTLIRRYAHDHHPLSPFFYFCLIGLSVSIWPMIYQEISPAFYLSGFFWLMALTVFAALAQLSLYKALSFIPSPEAGILGMTEVVWGGILGFVIFAEPITRRSLIGGFLIIGSGICLSLKSKIW